MSDKHQPPSINSTESNQPPDEAPIDLDQIFEILSNERRRRVIRYLKDVDEPVEVGALAEQIAAEENGKAVSELRAQERKRVHVGLYQVHIPKMDEYGVVSFNRQSGRIEAGPNIDLVRDYLPP